MTKFYDDVFLSTSNKETLKLFENFAQELGYTRYKYSEEVNYITKKPTYSSYFGKPDTVCICCETERR